MCKSAKDEAEFEELDQKKLGEEMEEAEKAAKKAIKKHAPGLRKRKACAEPIISQYGPRKQEKVIMAK